MARLLTLAVGFFSLAAIVAPNGRAQQEKLTLLTEENPPYSYTDRRSGQVGGTGVTIVTELMKRAGQPYQLTVLPWKRGFRHAQEDSNTCLFMTNRTAEREDLFQWVGPIIEGGWAVYKRPDSDISIQSPTDMQGYNVIGKSGSASVDQLEQAGGLTIMRAASDETAARLLFHGRADLWVSGLVDGPLATKAAGLPTPALAFLWKKADLSMACSHQTDPALIARLNDINQSLDDLRKQLLAQQMEDSTQAP